MRLSALLAVALTVTILAVPPTTEGQSPPGKTARIGYLGSQSGLSTLDEGFRQGLRELGYAEGQNILIEYRWADFNAVSAAALAAELVRLNVDVIVSVGGPISALAAKNATTTIPIVFETGDPVGLGLVPRLERPGGNLTGVENFMGELNVKRLELLKEAVPGISRVGVLANPMNPVTPKRLKEVEDAARALRITLQVLEARQPPELDVALAAMARQRAEVLLLMTDPMFYVQRARIVDLAAKHRLPGIFFLREFTDAGGLMSYSPNLADTRRRLATYVDRILKGARPGDLPIQQPTKFELVINLKTARALALTIPPSLLLRADQVIE